MVALDASTALTNPTLAFIGGLGTNEIIFVVFIVFLLFGAKKIPELMRSLGRAQGEFQKAKKEFETEAKGTDTTSDTTGDAKSDAKSDTTGDAAIPKTAEADLEKARSRAQELGIDAEGKDLDTLKREIADKVLAE